jgi:hypothetical protein
MNNKNGVKRMLFDWCLGLQWTWMMKLAVPATASVENAERHFRRWIMDIEMADGTKNFRWARVIPRVVVGPPDEYYVMVAGLSSDEWRWWIERWTSLTGDPNAQAVLEYVLPQRRDQLRKTIEKALGGERYDIEVRVGPQRIRDSRIMKVDNKGKPTDPAILLAPKARETKTPQTERVRWESLLDWGGSKKK